MSRSRGGSGRGLGGRQGDRAPSARPAPRRSWSGKFKIQSLVQRPFGGVEEKGWEVGPRHSRVQTDSAFGVQGLTSTWVAFGGTAGQRELPCPGSLGWEQISKVQHHTGSLETDPDLWGGQLRPTEEHGLRSLGPSPGQAPLGSAASRQVGAMPSCPGGTGAN